MLWKFINKLITEVFYTRKDVTGCQAAFQVPILYVGVELSDAISSKAHGNLPVYL